MSAPLLEVDDFRITLEGRALVQNVAFRLEPGERLGLLGASGAGKSLTALGLLGLCRIPGAQIEGAVRWHDADGALRPTNRKALARLVGYIPQSPALALDPLRRVGAFLRWGRKDAGVSRGDWDGRVLSLLERCGVENATARLRSFPHELSGGELQRVALAAALLRDPKALVADEPTSALDALRAHEFLRLVREICEERALSVLLISHDRRAMATLCSEALWMDEGRLVGRGSWAALAEQAESAEQRALFVPAGWESGAVTPRKPVPTTASPTPVLRTEGVTVSH